MRIRMVASSLIGILALTTPAESKACPRPSDPSSYVLRNFAAARSILVIRIESARAGAVRPQDDFRNNRISADVRVVEVFGGQEPKLRRIEYNSGNCGGIHLMVGDYYVIATSPEVEVFNRPFGDASVLGLDDWYFESDRANPKTIEGDTYSWAKQIGKRGLVTYCDTPEGRIPPARIRISHEATFPFLRSPNHWDIIGDVYERDFRDVDEAKACRTVPRNKLIR